MLFFLLTILFQIHQLDFNVEVFNQPYLYQQQLADHLMINKYISPYRVYRPLPPVKKSDFCHPPINISAQSAVLQDALSGQVLWQKNATAVMPIASLTKLMTAIIFLETNPDFSLEVTITESDESNVEGSRLYVRVGEKVTVGDLFYTSLVGSANNATKALARSTDLSEENFLLLMNEKAETLGLQNTEFRDVTGLDPSNKSTVLEYSRLAQYAFRKAKIKEALNMQEYVFTTVDESVKHRISNTNQLLSSHELNLIGAKTGYLDEAGYTFVCQSEKNGHGVIVTLFNSSSSSTRFSEAKELVSWAYNNFIWL